MLRRFTFAIFFLFANVITISSCLGEVSKAPIPDTPRTPTSTLPHSPSTRAIRIIKRQNICGAGLCASQDICCGGKGCCPGDASCCSNGSCCEAGTLCTQDSQGSIGCCPVGQTCAGSLAGSGETSTGIASSSAQTTTTQSSSTLVPTTSSTQDANKATASSESANDTNDPKDKAVATPTPEKGGIGGGTIIGAVIGGILGWLAICAGFFWFRKGRRQNNAGGTGTALSTPINSQGFPQQGQGPEFVGPKPEMVSDPNIGRPYTTLLERGALDSFSNPLPR